MRDRDDPDTAFLEATRTSYDAIAADYASAFPDAMGGLPFDRALISAFAEPARAHSPAPVAGLGSGPGHVTALVHGLGVPVFGVDLSPGMVALARRAYPALRFHVGTMTRLDLPDAFAEFHRVLRPGAPVLLTFQVADGQDRLHLTERFGHEIALDYHWRTPEKVARLLGEAGLEVYARALRERTRTSGIPGRSCWSASRARSAAGAPQALDGLHRGQTVHVPRRPRHAVQEALGAG
ncbi:class I SAM-dependent methyltransferase [Streptomyces sp. NPDC086077]|uniref:class I SAM-dependent DNA methyltransferase n=1 Tax=Streptomyces sp. NPDC086077 TaxID=3154862 RepID=UPI00341EFAF7